MNYVPRFLREYAAHIRLSIAVHAPEEKKKYLTSEVERLQWAVGAGLITVEDAMEELVRIQNKVKEK